MACPEKRGEEREREKKKGEERGKFWGKVVESGEKGSKVGFGSIPGGCELATLKNHGGSDVLRYPRAQAR
jgi:hypothetical protein